MTNSRNNFSKGKNFSVNSMWINKFAVILIVLFASISIFSQDQDLFRGEWNLTNAEPYVTITGTPFQTLQVFAIKSNLMNGKSNYQLQIIADGFAQPLFMEGGTIIVEAKTVSIKRAGSIGPTTDEELRGSWEIIQRPGVPAYAFGFDQIAVGKSLATTLQTSQEFVLFLPPISPQICDSLRFTVEIDGATIKDQQGNEIKYAPGNSVYGSGKKVSFTTFSFCTGTQFQPFNAYLKIKR